MSSGREKKPRRDVAVGKDRQPVVAAATRLNGRSPLASNRVLRANRDRVRRAHATASIAPARRAPMSGRNTISPGRRAAHQLAHIKANGGIRLAATRPGASATPRRSDSAITSPLSCCGRHDCRMQSGSKRKCENVAELNGLGSRF